MSNQSISIQVIGSDCPNCNKLLELVRRADREMKLDAGITYITDINKMISLGIMSTPALAINDRPILFGRVPKIEELKGLIKENL